MYNLIEAAEQALENAKAYDKEDLFGFDEDIDALRTAIANAQQAEPVAWMYWQSCRQQVTFSRYQITATVLLGVALIIIFL